MSAELAAIYGESNTRFAFVGPLLDQAWWDLGVPKIGSGDPGTVPQIVGSLV